MRSAALAAGTLLSTWLAFRGEAGGVSPLLFLPYLLLGWLALRTGVFTASVTMLLTAAIAVGATIAAQGPFAQAAPTASLAMLAGYLATLAAMPLLVTALTGELGSTEQRWQLALAASQLGVADWDLHAGEIEFSSRWHALLDEPALPSQEPAQGFWSRLHDDDRASVQVALASLRDAHSEAARAECRMRRSDGSWRWFELNALAAERDPAGEPLRLVATLRDVHGEREANAREQAAELGEREVLRVVLHERDAYALQLERAEALDEERHHVLAVGRPPDEVLDHEQALCLAPVAFGGDFAPIVRRELQRCRAAPHFRAQATRAQLVAELVRARVRRVHHPPRRGCGSGRRSFRACVDIGNAAGVRACAAARRSRARGEYRGKLDRRTRGHGRAHCGDGRGTTDDLSLSRRPRRAARSLRCRPAPRRRRRARTR